MKILLSFLLLFQFAASQHRTTQRLKPFRSVELDQKLPEGSGLAAWNGMLWTHNDSGEPMLFALDTITGKIINEFRLPGVAVIDWEDIAQDSLYFYLADTGNNFGEREKLQILRIEKQSLLDHKPAIDNITFSWPEVQLSDRKGRIVSTEKEHINFDCEALIVYNDSLYLFTKEWKKKRVTRIFSIPKVPGTYTAKYLKTIPTRVAITGASYHDQNLILCGYNRWLKPFILTFPDAKGIDFFSGAHHKFKVKKNFRQIEGIATFDGKNFYLINEDFKILFLHTEQEMHLIKF